MTYSLLQGDVRAMLRTLRAESVHCVITSPPYWGLRSYGTEPQVWGGRPDCPHEWQTRIRIAKGQSYGANASSTLTTGTTQQRREEVQKLIGKNVRVPTGVCLKCHTWRGELGLEPSLELYVQHLVEVFREIRRVLRKDGTLWLNLGDSYAGSWGGFGDRECKQRNRVSEVWNRRGYENFKDRPPTADYKGLKRKDLCGIPWRVAFALQENGWWLRSDIVWHKPNPMPESVADRPTKAHEYVFLLTKSEKYYFDQDAVREPLADSTLADRRNGTGRHTQGEKEGSKYGVENRPDLPSWYRGKAFVNPEEGRNIRTVWKITTQPFKEAHFATFPEKLVERCIKAGTSEGGCCPTCEAPRRRGVKKMLVQDGPTRHRGARKMRDGESKSMTMGDGGVIGHYEVKTTGWHPTCVHDLDPFPCTVLDPFCGSGTVGVIALRYNRKFIGIELKAEYVEMARKRIAQDNPLFNMEKKGESSSLC